MAELISTFGIGTVAIILLVSIPAIINFITWCKSIWAKREKFKQENIDKGRAIAVAQEAEEHRFESGETRMAQLELMVTELAALAKEQKKTNDRLIRSDKLAIKTWIKEQHDIWMRKGCIDSHVLELLEERFEIYKEEGGNSWAEKLMNELRSLPVAVVIPINNDKE